MVWKRVIIDSKNAIGLTDLDQDIADCILNYLDSHDGKAESIELYDVVHKEIRGSLHISHIKYILMVLILKKKSIYYIGKGPDRNNGTIRLHLDSRLFKRILNNY